MKKVSKSVKVGFVCGFIGLILGSCFGEETVIEEKIIEVPVVQEEVVQEEVVQEEVVQEEVVQEEQNVFPLGHRIGNDKIEVVFFNAYYTDDRNQFSDTKADKVLIIEYEYKNINAGDEFALFEGIHFEVYDGDGYRLETYPAIETYYGGQVSEGRSAKSSEAFAVVGNQTHYEIEIGGCIVEFDLE